ncbi:hypothetical protein NQ318_000234 [Aromia moschata]|uniref:Uncharacterized protein n=1 Tax=Aromia moschata TaxID=1265417 RepID=A0AAV8XBA7_9CUCU|nr:hypothetical protein NQ318_000234 [Aromia moschata]
MGAFRDDQPLTARVVSLTVSGLPLPDSLKSVAHSTDKTTERIMIELLSSQHLSNNILGLDVKTAQNRQKGTRNIRSWRDVWALSQKNLTLKEEEDECDR